VQQAHAVDDSFHTRDGVQVKDNDKAVTDALGLSESPSLLVLKPDGGRDVYDGE
jgi:hypothetical protein